MSVLIKGMKMPKNCMECPFKGFDRAKGRGNICTIDETITLHAVLDGLDVKFVNVGDCPLVPIPDHGDLVERDEIMKHEVYIPRDGGNLPVVYMSYVKAAKTVIPAERSEDD